MYSSHCLAYSGGVEGVYLLELCFDILILDQLVHIRHVFGKEEETV